MQNEIGHIIAGRERDLGGFSVRRILPYAMHRMVGPFIFFDHMGPARFPPGEGLNVRPHPHIGLATLTYLFDGGIRHRDSLGSDQLIEAGAVNWMIAGKGIVHSERSPEDLRSSGSGMNGIQCWIALPKDDEDCEPSFDHYPASSIPDFTMDKTQVRLLAGTAFGRASPVRTFSDLCYLELKMPKGASLTVPAEGRDLAAYLVSGTVRIADQDFAPLEMIVAQDEHDIRLTAREDAHVMIIGGRKLDGPRKIFWNFVSSSAEKIEAAKERWKKRGFPLIPGDDNEFIPLPDESRNPPGTIM